MVTFSCLSLPPAQCSDPSNVLQMFAGWMTRETFLLEFLIFLNVEFSGRSQNFIEFRNLPHSVHRWDSENLSSIFFSRGNLCSVRQIHPPHTCSLDLLQIWGLSVLTKLPYVNIFWIFNYFQYREHIWIPLPVILHLLPHQTAWENEFLCNRGHRKKLRTFFFFN